MQFTPFDLVIFFSFIIIVITVGIMKSRKEENSEDYFLAGRGLSWWLIGFSLIAANISTEQFVGMSGSAAGSVGMAIASYEWMAAITLVVTAFVFLPKFLRSGIYTIPEFLKYRYNETSRSIMAFFTMIIYIGVTIAAVIYSGALTINTLFAGQTFFGLPINVVTGSWIIGIIAAVYVASGGLKACAWADLIQGSALIIGGGFIAYFAFKAIGATPIADLATTVAVVNIPENAGAIAKFAALNEDKLHMILPMSNQVVPWTALMVGLWIPNFYYWGLNQYITQRTLGSKSLAQGQKGIVFAAGLKLIIPFIIVLPGIAAFNLFHTDMADEAAKDEQINDKNAAIIMKYEQIKAQPEAAQYVVFNFDKGWADRNTDKAVELAAYNAKVKEAAAAANAKVEEKHLLGYKYDTAFALLINKLVPSGKGLQGFILAAILGAVVSSLASMLNSASTIFTMDIYRKYINKKATQKGLVGVGRICVGVFVVIGCLIAPVLGNPKFGGIFHYIQEFQGFISPGILAVFVFGLIVKKAPGICGVVGLLINPLMYGLLKMILPNLAFLDRMAVSFFCVLIVMGIITAIKPLPKAYELPTNTKIDLKSSGLAKALGIVVCAATVVLYIIFW